MKPVILKPVIWIASSKKDINSFSNDVKETFGEALMYAQCGEKHPKTKILRHQGSGSILEVVEDSVGGTYRLIYTVKFEEAVIVLHVFQKKSNTKIKTSQQDKDLIHSRLQLAKQVYENWLQNGKR